MVKKEELIINFYEALEDKYGSRFLGFLSVDNGIIDGQIDNRYFILRINYSQILFEISFLDDDRLLLEISNLIRECVDDDMIRCEYAVTSKDRNVEELDLYLSYNLNEEKGYRLT